MRPLSLAQEKQATISLPSCHFLFVFFFFFFFLLLCSSAQSRTKGVGGENVRVLGDAVFHGLRVGPWRVLRHVCRSHVKNHVCAALGVGAAVGVIGFRGQVERCRMLGPPSVSEVLAASNSS